MAQLYEKLSGRLKSNNPRIFAIVLRSYLLESGHNGIFQLTSRFFLKLFEKQVCDEPSGSLYCKLLAFTTKWNVRRD